MKASFWTVLVLGVWLTVSPWALGVSALNTVVLNSAVVGILLILLAAWALFGNTQ